MTRLAFPWLSAAVVLPLVAATLCRRVRGADALRALAFSAVAGSLLCCVGAAVDLHASNAPFAVDALDPGAHLVGRPVLAIDDLNAVLTPFAALLAAVVLLAAPRAWFLSGGGPRALFAVSALLASFACVDGATLAGLWAVAAIPVWSEFSPDPRARRVFLVYMGLALGCMAAGVTWLGTHAGAGTALVLVAVLLRKGIVPLHSWMPEMFERASPATATLFNAPQLGAYVAARLVVPAASEGLLLVMGSLALLTAVYGAGLALVQREGRRAYGFLFMSQSALVLVGLDCTSEAGLTGGLLWWVASGLSLAGQGICLWLLEARRGQTSLRELQGGFERMPVLAASFLILGLASVGFPGTIGFVGAELLVGGAVEDFPHAGFVVLIAAGLNAITVLRMYFTLFCGRRVAMPGHQRLRPHESAAMAVLIAAVVAAGLWPRPLVASRARAAAAILAARPAPR
jgi:NADH-quinone oxidoreductase subunit M